MYQRWRSDHYRCALIAVHIVASLYHAPDAIVRCCSDLAKGSRWLTSPRTRHTPSPNLQTFFRVTHVSRITHDSNRIPDTEPWTLELSML